MCVCVCVCVCVTNTSHPTCLRLTKFDRCKTRGKTASLKHTFTGCKNALRSYTWRHNKVLEIFTEASKIFCETANKALNNINNRPIHFFKEGNSSNHLHKNMYRSSLFAGCKDWHVTTDLGHHFVFPTEITFTTQRPDIVKLKKKVFVIDSLEIEVRTNS